MAQYYVDSATGNDTTGTGTSGAPWATIQKAIDNSGGGDTINLSNVQKFTPAAELQWTTGWAGGTGQDSPLIIQSWDNGGSITITDPTAAGNTIVAAEIDGSSTYNKLFASTSIPTYVIVRRLKVHSYNQNGINASTGWHVFECEVYDIGTGYAIDGGSTCSIIRNYVHSPKASSNGQGIKVSVRAIVAGNYVEDMYGISIGVDDESSCINNIIYNCSGDGIVSIGPRNYILNNTIIGDDATAGSNGITFSNASYDNAVVMGNLIMDFSGTGSYAINATAGVSMYLVGPNGLYNNANTYTGLTTIFVDNTADDVTSTVEPLEDKAAGDFSPVVGAEIETGNVLFGGPLGTTTDRNNSFGAIPRQTPPAAGGGGSGATSHYQGGIHFSG